MHSFSTIRGCQENVSFETLAFSPKNYRRCHLVLLLESRFFSCFCDEQQFFFLWISLFDFCYSCIASGRFLKHVPPSASFCRDFIAITYEPDNSLFVYLKCLFIFLDKRSRLHEITFKNPGFGLLLFRAILSQLRIFKDICSVKYIRLSDYIKLYPNLL